MKNCEVGKWPEMGEVFLKSETEENLRRKLQEIIAQVNKINEEKNMLERRLGIVEEKCRKMEEDREKMNANLNYLFETYMSMNNELKAAERAARIANKENTYPPKGRWANFEEYENSTMRSLENNFFVRRRRNINVSTDSNSFVSTNENDTKLIENYSRQSPGLNSRTSNKNNNSINTTKQVQQSPLTSNPSSKRNSNISTTSSTSSLSSVAYDTILGVL